MVYETFQTVLTEKLTQRLGPDCRLLIQKIPKNNGVILDGLCIGKKGASIAPTVYLNSYFEQYQEGASIEQLVEEISQLYSRDSSFLRTDFSIINDFSRLKSKIVYKLIHTAANINLLKDIPSIPYLDLSIVFYLYLDESPSGQMTALIYNHHLAAWDTSIEELYQLASQNTPFLFPPDLKTMSQIMQEILRRNCDNEETLDFMQDFSKSQPLSPLYVLTNSAGINGACTILYPKVLQNLSQQLKQDLVILPSSIHEVLLVPFDEHISLDELSDMVKQVNQAEVAMEEQLSDHVYYYSYSSDKVLILQDSASPKPC